MNVKSKDGEAQARTWFLYGGLALGVLSLASLIGSSAARRPDAAVE
jgi:hypothetical protein